MMTKAGEQNAHQLFTLPRIVSWRNEVPPKVRQYLNSKVVLATERACCP